MALFLAGCDTGPGYGKTDPLGPAASGTNRAVWKATGDLGRPEAAIDGNISTIAVSGRSYNGATITIDLGKTCVFNLVVLDHGAQEYGFARRTSLLTSLDGQKFDLQWTAPGTRRVTILCPLRSVLARYVRIQASAAGPQPWAIAELYIQ